MAFGKVGGVQTRDGYRETLGYVQLTGISTAKSFSDLSVTIPDGTTLAMIQPESQNIRWRDDGSNPTSSVGMIVVANDILYYTGAMSAIKFIEVSATAKVNVTFYK